MVGLEKLQLFTSLTSDQGRDFYAPMIKSFGYFCEPQSTPPEGGFQNYTFLEINLLQNSSNQSTEYQYQAVYLEGIINPMGNSINLVNIPFKHKVKVIYEGTTSPIDPPLQEPMYADWNTDQYPGIDTPISTPIEASLNNSNQLLSFSVNLTYLNPGQQFEPQYKISGRYYLI